MSPTLYQLSHHGAAGFGRYSGLLFKRNLARKRGYQRAQIWDVSTVDTMETVTGMWGNSVAVRLPREIPGVGRLEPGMVLEIEVKIVRDVRTWKPYTVAGGPGDLSTNHDQYVADKIVEEANRWQSSTRVS